MLAFESISKGVLNFSNYNSFLKQILLNRAQMNHQGYVNL